MLIILYIFNSSHLWVELFYYNRVHASPESVPYFHKLYSESGNTVCISLKRETAVVLDESLPKDDRLSDSGLPISLIFWFFFNLVEFKPKNKSYIFYL